MTITVYSKPSCPQCIMTKRHLDRTGTVYVTVDVTVDAAAMDTVRAMGYRALPVVVAGDVHFAGFRPDRLDEITTNNAA